MTFSEFATLLRKADLGEVTEGALGATLARARTLAQQRAPRRSGALAASIRTRAAHGRGTITGGLVAGSSRVPYARIQEEGGVIRGNPWLKFRIGGTWAQVRQVIIPARPYLRPSLEQAAGETLRIEMDRRLRDRLGGA